MRLTIYRTPSGFRWRAVARNGRIVVASSEAFTRAADARRNLERAAEALGDWLLLGAWAERPPTGRRRVH